MASVTFEPRRRATRKLVLLDTADVTRPPWRFTRESASSLRCRGQRYEAVWTVQLLTG